MRPTTITKTINVNELFIRPGEFVTVWLVQHDGSRVEVELRVDDVGRREISLSNPNAVTITNSMSWESHCHGSVGNLNHIPEIGAGGGSGCIIGGGSSNGGFSL